VTPAARNAGEAARAGGAARRDAAPAPAEQPVTDGSVTDAGGADGSVTDAGGADGSVTDAGGADGSVTDAGGADGSVTDAAGVDRDDVDAEDVDEADLPDRRHDDYAAAGRLFIEFAALAADDPRRRRLRDELVTLHLPVARHIAAKFRNRGEPGDDLEQVATLGLINAVDRYDPSRGIAFLAYAVPTMMGEVRRYFRDTAWSIRLPRRLSELHLALGRASRELSQTLGSAPTPRQLAEHLGISVAEVQEGLEAGQSYRAASLDDSGGGSDESSTALVERLGEQDHELEMVENRAVLGPLLEGIAERERRILIMRFFEHMTQTQIAERVGLSQMHVSRLLARTLEQLRARLSEAMSDDVPQQGDRPDQR
jgi:RNA polymerase sigma-B factor